MNKVYKLVWSKARNMYVAVSELAKNRSKFTRGNVISKAVVAGVLAAVISCGWGTMPVFAAAADTVKTTQANTTKLFLTGKKVSTDGNVDELFLDTNIYATTTAGQLHVGSLQSGGAITGTGVTISGATPVYVAKTTGITVGTNPTAAVTKNIVLYQDSAGKNLSAIQKYVNTDGSSATRLYDYDNQDATGAYIAVLHDKSGNGYTYAPTPATTDNSTKIATTAYVRSNVTPSADGTFVKKANTAAANLTALDDAAKNAIKALSVSGKVITYTKGDGTTGTITTQDNNTTYAAFKGATADAAGGAGLVTAPAKGQQNYVLHGDGTWKADANTTYAAMTAAEATEGTATTARSITAKVLGDYVKSKTDDKVTGLSVNGKVITYTKGDGTTGTITTQDNNTTYTAGNGLALSGTAFSAKAGTNVTVNTNGINVPGGATVASGNTGLMTGANAYTELRPTDGTFVKQANTTKANLAALDDAAENAIKSMYVTASNDISYTRGDGTTGSSSFGSLTMDEFNSGSTSKRMISGQMLHNAINSEVRPSDGSFIKASNTTAANLTALDKAVRTNLGSVVADDDKFLISDSKGSPLAQLKAGRDISFNMKTITGELHKGTDIMAGYSTLSNLASEHPELYSVTYDELPSGIPDSMTDLQRMGFTNLNFQQAEGRSLDTILSDLFAIRATSPGNAAQRLMQEYGYSSNSGIVKVLQGRRADNGNPYSGSFTPWSVYNSLKTVADALTYNDKIDTISITGSSVKTKGILQSKYHSGLTEILPTTSYASLVDFTGMQDGQAVMLNANQAFDKFLTRLNDYEITDHLLAEKAFLMSTLTPEEFDSIFMGVHMEQEPDEHGELQAVYYTDNLDALKAQGKITDYMYNYLQKGIIDDYFATDHQPLTKIRSDVESTYSITNGMVPALMKNDTGYDLSIANIGINSDNEGANMDGAGATGTDSIAIGRDAVSSGNGSVALGLGSVADEENVVSIGNDTVKRRITHVADGTSVTDVATVGQTIELVAGDGMTIEEDGTNAIGQKKYKLSSFGGGTAPVQNAVLYDDSTRNKATLTGGVTGTTLDNVRSGLISKTSKEAINGGQLWSVKQDIEGFAEDIRRNTNSIQTLNGSVSNALASVAAANNLVNTMNDLKADASLNNLSVAGKQVISNAAIDAVQQYMAQQENASAGTDNVNTGMSTNYNTNISDLISDLSDNGSVSVPKSRMLATSLRTDPISLLGADPGNEQGSGVTAEDLALKADITYVDNSLAAKADTDYVNEALNKKADVAYVDNGLVGKADLLYVDGELAKKADISYVDEGLSLKANKNDVYSKAETDRFLSEKADVAYVDKGLSEKANKSDVYNRSEIDDKLFVKADKEYVDNGLALKADKIDLAAKANTDASNIDVSVWSDKLGVGEVGEGNTGLVNGGAVYNAMQEMSRESLVTVDGSSIRVGSHPKYDEAYSVDIADSQGNARVITGVAVDPKDPYSAVNVGYLSAVEDNIIQGVKDNFNKTNERIDKVGAGAAALASLATPAFDGDEKFAFAAAVGNYKSETAAAVGMFYRPQDNVTMNIRGTVGNGENMVGGGVTVSLNRGNTPAISKAQLVRTINAQAQAIQEMKAERISDKAEIAELKSMVQELAAKQKD